ncbi:MAG: methyltransferase domain-containing protein [candidate division WOR-3 bacterium]|nr:methyltransferase domain-containing protein [candidate division WOR-3 bacterium]
MPPRDYIPVAPVWERNPDDSDIWRRVVVMPSLALNQAEMEFLGPIAGKRVCVIGTGDGMAPLALAAMGAKVRLIDPSNSGLDVVMVRAQIVGVELDYQEAELTNLSSLGENVCEIAYAAQVAGLIEDLGTFYQAVFSILEPGGRLVVNEYHPIRRIWKQEPGPPRLAFSYFERRRPRGEEDFEEGFATPGKAFGRYNYHWTVSDHFYFLSQAGFKVVGLEEVGDVRQHWEMPNLSGMPEQLVIAADKPKK